MNRVTIKLSEIPIAVYSESGYMADFCRSYLSDESPLFSVSTTKEAVTAEVENAPEPTTYNYAEALCLYREMAERLPLYDRAVFHGAAIEYGGKAYLFTAPSGTGKTTHITTLWRKLLGEKVDIINGDKPILHLNGDGITVTVRLTPEKRVGNAMFLLPLPVSAFCRRARTTTLKNWKAVCL